MTNHSRKKVFNFVFEVKVNSQMNEELNIHLKLNEEDKYGYLLKFAKSKKKKIIRNVLCAAAAVERS